MTAKETEIDRMDFSFGRPKLSIVHLITKLQT